MHDFDLIPADRLLQAADAIFEAAAEQGSPDFTRSPVEMLGSVDQPAAFEGFTHAEILEAQHFLVRCGLFVIDEK